MASRAYAPPVEDVVKLPPVLAFTLGVPVAPRSAVEAVIEKMIAALDEIDGDPDLEDYEGTHRVDARGRILPDTFATPGLREDDEDGGDMERDEDTWSTFGSQWTPTA